MGIIKKLKGGELVGWTLDPSIDVYPITHIGAIYDSHNNTLESLLSGLLTSISNTLNNSIVYLWAYTNASNDGIAAGKLNRDENADVPSNYYSNTGAVVLGAGERIYMTTARKLGNTYLLWDDNHIWSSPISMSNNTTSGTGSDTTLYNFIYCVTTDGSLSNTPMAPTFSVSAIEALSPGQGLTQSGALVTNDVGNPGVWRDHPIGVSQQHQCEWVCVAKKSNTWGAYQGPYLWSQFGIAGRDGDGVEFIFTSLAADAQAPTLEPPYNGSVGETPYTNVLVTSSEYQLDDFIPTGWYDEPLDLTNDLSVLYVSIRRKEWQENESASKWGAFTRPTKWSELMEAIYQVTLDNDSVFLDDDTKSQTLRNISCTSVHIWDGKLDITNLPYAYTEVMVIPSNGGETLFEIAPVDRKVAGLIYPVAITGDEDYTSGHGFEYGFDVDTYKRDLDSNGTLEITFCLSLLDETLKLPLEDFSMTYQVTVYEDNTKSRVIAQATRKQNIKVLDINDGAGYSLVVTPNSLPISRTSTSSPYTFEGNLSTASVTVRTIKCLGDSEVSYCPLAHTRGGITTEEEGSLFVRVTPYNASNQIIEQQENLPLLISCVGNETTTLTYTVGGLDKNCRYYIVDLYILHEVNGTLTAFNIDSETVDLSIKGDNGDTSYYIAMTNDSAVIDDLTTNVQALSNLTMNTITVYHGSQDITFATDDNDDPVIVLQVEADSTLTSLPSNLHVANVPYHKDLWYLTPISGANISLTIPIGSYYYTISAKKKEGNSWVTVALKVFTLQVIDITSDGTAFSLNITNDVWSYNGSLEYIGTASESVISVSAVRTTSSGLNVSSTAFDLISANLLNSYTPTAGLQYPLVVTFPADYIELVNTGTKRITPSSTYTGGPIDFKLYYIQGGSPILVDSEVIDLRKDGKNGKNGEGAYTMSFDNDTGLIDNDTMSDSLLRLATENTITVRQGKTTLDFGNDQDYLLYITGLQMPSGMKLMVGSTSITSFSTTILMTSNTMYFLKGSNPPSKWTDGDYYVIIQARDGDDVLDTKKYKLKVAEISSDGSVYKLELENDVWPYDGNTNLLLNNNNSRVLVMLIGSNGLAGDPLYNLCSISVALEGASLTSSSGFVVTYPSVLSGNISLNNNVCTIYPLSSYPSSSPTITLKLYYNGVFTGEAETIQCSLTGRDGAAGGGGAQGIRGAILRNRGMWAPNRHYCYNSNDYGVAADSENDIVYIDVVYLLERNPANYPVLQFYSCKMDHTSPNYLIGTISWDTYRNGNLSNGNFSDHWVPIQGYEAIATKMLVANTADIEVLNGGSLVVHDDLGNIVGGMTGGTANATNDVIIWAGGNSPTNANNKFKVYEDGKVIIKGPIVYLRTKDLNEVLSATSSNEYNACVSYNYITGTLYSIDMDSYPAETFIGTPVSSNLNVILPSDNNYLGLELDFYFAPPATRTATYEFRIQGRIVDSSITAELTTYSYVLLSLGGYVKLKCLPIHSIGITDPVWKILLGEDEVTFTNSAS